MINPSTFEAKGGAALPKAHEFPRYSYRMNGTVENDDGARVPASQRVTHLPTFTEVATEVSVKDKRFPGGGYRLQNLIVLPNC